MTMETILKILGGFVPDDTEDARSHYRWRLRVGLGLMVTFFMCVTLSVFAFGLMPSVFPGFIQAGEISKMQRTVDTKIAALTQQVLANNTEQTNWRITQLNQALLDAQSKHCKARTDEGKRLYWQAISSMMSDYRRLTGSSFDLPACSDL